MTINSPTLESYFDSKDAPLAFPIQLQEKIQTLLTQFATTPEKAQELYTQTLRIYHASTDVTELLHLLETGKECSVTAKLVRLETGAKLTAMNEQIDTIKTGFQTLDNQHSEYIRNLFQDSSTLAEEVVA